MNLAHRSETPRWLRGHAAFLSLNLDVPTILRSSFKFAAREAPSDQGGPDDA